MFARWRPGRGWAYGAVTAIAIVFLAGFWWMSVSVSRVQCSTADEIAHLTAGYSYWLTNDYRLQPENGNLPQRWAALPLLAMHLRFPSRDQLAWRISDVWDIGFQWFYKQGNDLGRMLWAGRAMIALLGVALGWLVFCWSRELFGSGGALVSVALFAFSPNLLAHAGLATSDMAATLFFLAAVYAYWRMLHQFSAGRVLLFGLALGGLCLAKFSAPLFVFMAVAMLAVRAAQGSPLAVSWPWQRPVEGRWRLLGVLAAGSVAAALLAVAMIWAAYGFRYRMFNHFQPGQVRSLVGWDVLEDQPGLVVDVVNFARAHHLLPESYLYGFAHTYRFARYRSAFFNGDYRSGGWVWFFPYTTATKTPLGFFALIGAAAIGAWTQRRRLMEGLGRRLYPLTPLAALFGIYWAFALTSHLNIGHRHVLPTYPVMFICAGAAIPLLAARSRIGLAATVGLLGWFAADSLLIRPHYLAYFNELIGGPSQAYNHVVDSSLDWGQDLPGLKTWLDAHAVDPDGRRSRLFISYFGSGDPEYYGIDGTRFGDSNFDLRSRRFPALLSGGLYAISVTMFQRVYVTAGARGPWDEKKETRYRALLNRVAAHDLPADPQKRRGLLAELEDYQFSRLCQFLSARRPTALVDYTILIFRLTDEEVAQALYGPASELPRSRLVSATLLP